MKPIQVQGVLHIARVGSTRSSAIGSWQGLLGMKLRFEQPNLGNPDENHLRITEAHPADAIAALMADGGGART